jgi:uncharacterized 2Fe-2S/4Fe-4S cluster protein (DUF4445 family)
MPIVDIKGYGRFKAKKGSRLIDCLIKNNLPVTATCAGNGRCGSCRIKIIRPKQAPNDKDLLFLPQHLIKKGFRLACQLKITRDIEITVPKRKKTGKINKEKDLGLALDIGTTVIKGAVINLRNGDIEKIDRVYNEQNRIGGDVLSRIGAALSGKYGLQYELLKSSINRLKDNLGIQSPVITAVAGNPVMLAFYLRKSVRGMAHYPFNSKITKGTVLQRPLRYVFPVIAGFVGGDTLSGLMASRLYSGDQNNLYIDLGTNGEVVLINNKRIFAASTAAGPAFEGIGIKYGCLAIPGAITHIRYSRGDFVFTTIENKNPQGFCASGFLELLALILDQGLLNISGRLAHDINIASLMISQADIRKLQLAIGAIHSGIKILLNKAKIKANSINNAVITGEFGSRLDMRVLTKIGLLPKGINKVAFKKDLPLNGAIEIIKDPKKFYVLDSLRKHSIHVDLAMQPDFQDIFVSALELAEWK